MRIFIASLVMLIGVSFAGAADMTACLHYLYPDAPEGSWVLQDDSDGRGAYIKEWKVEVEQPSAAQLEAVNADAVAWWTDKRNTLLAARVDSLEQLVAILTRELNEIRAQVGLPEKTTAQIVSGQ